MELKTRIMKLNTMIKSPIVAVLSGLCIIASIQAQTNESKDQPAVVSMAPTEDLPIFNIDFPGGTPEELVQQLAKASGTSPNVIIPIYVADVQIPKFRLQNVNTRQVFDALNMVPDEKGARDVRWISEGAKGGSNRVWTLAKAAAKQRAETCQVAFIGYLLDSFQLDDINAAIRTSWEMLGKSSTATLKFHKETKLLIAKGDEEELKLAFEVLKSLQQAAAVKKQAVPNK
jgi:hypothetical protein